MTRDMSPANGDARTPLLTRQGEPDASCEECSMALEAWEGRLDATG